MSRPPQNARRSWGKRKCLSTALQGNKELMRARARCPVDLCHKRHHTSICQTPEEPGLKTDVWSMTVPGTWFLALADKPLEPRVHTRWFWCRSIAWSSEPYSGACHSYVSSTVTDFTWVTRGGLQPWWEWLENQSLRKWHVHERTREPLRVGRYGEPMGGAPRWKRYHWLRATMRTRRSRFGRLTHWRPARGLPRISGAADTRTTRRVVTLRIRITVPDAFAGWARRWASCVKPER